MERSCGGTGLGVSGGYMTSLGERLMVQQTNSTAESFGSTGASSTAMSTPDLGDSGGSPTHGSGMSATVLTPIMGMPTYDATGPEKVADGHRLVYDLCGSRA